MFQDPYAAKDAIASGLRRWGLSKELEQYRWMMVFAGICGKALSARVRPERVDKRVLFVRVSHSLWLQELSMMKPDLLKKMEEAGAPVRDIRFLVGPTDALPNWLE